jgi:hypothetical protein
VFGDADLRVFCRDMGACVTFGFVSTYSDGEPVKGNLNQPGKDAMFGDTVNVKDQEFCLELPYNAFDPFPAQGDLLIVDGMQYKVRSTDPQSDGGIVEIKLRKLQ